MFLVFSINAFVSILAVVIHYEALRQLTYQLPNLAVKPQLRVALGVFGCLLTHLAEIWLFAITYYALLHFERFGNLQGNFDGSLADCAYFSMTAYTSLGIGDIEPFGLVRFISGMEALLGLLLITWSASFMFLEMQKYWRRKL